MAEWKDVKVGEKITGKMVAMSPELKAEFGDVQSGVVEYVSADRIVIVSDKYEDWKFQFYTERDELLEHRKAETHDHS